MKQAEIPEEIPEEGSPTARFKRNKPASKPLELAPFLQPDNQRIDTPEESSATPKTLSCSENVQEKTKIPSNDPQKEPPTPRIRSQRTRTIKHMILI